MAKKISKASQQRSQEQPTTGDGRRGGRKPRLQETNLGGSSQGARPTSRLRVIADLVKGKHRKNG